MDKIICLIAIIVILFSYKILEKFFKRFFPSFVKYQLWDSMGYYCWGVLLLGIYLTVKPYDYIMNIPINNRYGIMLILFYIAITFYVCTTDPSAYYPRKTNKLRCFHFSIIQPLFEELSFRGLILPITISLLGENGVIIILLNGVLFMLFHLNYWGFKKERQGMFLNFLLHGLLFSFITLKTQSIIYAIICHIIVNGGITIYRNWKNEIKPKEHHTV